MGTAPLSARGIQWFAPAPRLCDSFAFRAASAAEVQALQGRASSVTAPDPTARSGAAIMAAAVPTMSTRIFLIAHTPLASALRDCAMHVFPDCAQHVLVLDVQPDATPEDSLAQARQLLGGQEQGALLV